MKSSRVRWVSISGSRSVARLLSSKEEEHIEELEFHFIFKTGIKMFVLKVKKGKNNNLNLI